MFSRREFLRTSSLIALAPTVPSFLAQAARAAGPAVDRRILVVIQLDGGNDGINTVVPFADEGYAKARVKLRLPTTQLCRITKEVGLHPAMGDAAKILESGRLAIVQGVGYPNPSRSHFNSMAIWHSANVNLPRSAQDVATLEDKATFGWIGHALDQGQKPADGSPGAVFVGTGSLPAALRSRRSVASALTRPEDSLLVLKGSHAMATTEKSRGDDLAAFVQRSTLDAYSNSARMAEVIRNEDKSSSYPATALAARLRVVARLIKGDAATRFYYTTQGSYDTHYVQEQAHSLLLGELSGAIRAFLDDLVAAKIADRVLVLCFSEFGRRVKENGSQGTDHGTAGPVFLAGTKVSSGLIGNSPKLLDLQDGDLKMIIDFRQVYATVLEDWLGLSYKLSLDGEFAKLPLLLQ
jgi:uncharacterized protein (DUF1501 family)